MTPETDDDGPDPELDPVHQCETARAAIARFLDGGLERAEDRRFRNHLVKCSECTALYRQTIAAAASMGRALRTGKQERSRVSRSEGMRKRAIDATGDGRRRNRFGLRLALLPAGLALLLILFRAGGGDRALFVHWEHGTVLVGESILGEALPALRLEPGAWVTTDVGARAVFRNGSAGEELVEVASDTQLLLIDGKRIELRLEQGELELVGPATVQTVHGVLRIDGRARLEVRDERYRVECLAGGAEWIGPTLVRALVQGERVESSLREDALTAAR